MAAGSKELSRRVLEEIFSEGRMEAADEIVSPECTYHDPANPDTPDGPEGLKQVVQKYRTAFPDQRMTVEDQVAEGDTVATRWTAHGTHDGRLGEIEPTGKRVTVPGVTIDRYRDGKVVESWSYWDALGLMRQLGQMPTRKAAD